MQDYELWFKKEIIILLYMPLFVLQLQVTELGAPKSEHTGSGWCRARFLCGYPQRTAMV